MTARILLALAVLVCTSASARTRRISSTDLRALGRTMAGDYSSAAQAATDTDFYTSTLRMVAVLEKRKEGYWLYVEQAMTTAPMQPYRQCVYHRYLADDTTVAN